MSTIASWILPAIGVLFLCGIFWAHVWEGTQCVGSSFCF